MAKPRKRFKDSMMQEAYEKGYLSPYPDVVNPMDQSRETWQKDYPEYTRKSASGYPAPTHWDEHTRRPPPGYHARSYIVPGQRERFEKSPGYLQAKGDLQKQEAELDWLRRGILSPEEVRRQTIDEMNRVDEARKQLVLEPRAPGSWPYDRRSEVLKEQNRLLALQDLARREAEQSRDYLGEHGTVNRELAAWAGLEDQDRDALYDLFESQQAPPEALRRPYLPPEIPHTPPQPPHSGALGRIPFMGTSFPLDVFLGASGEQGAPESLTRTGLPPELTLREQQEQAYWENSELDQIKFDEAFRSKVYKDSEGIDTIGYGFNLERPEAQAELGHAGIDKTIADLRSGKQSLTEAEADLLIRSEIPKFESAAMNFVGEQTWNSLSRDKQNILTNMAFNLGSTRLNKFNNLRSALQAGDYEKARDEMYDSKWRKQVKSRATRLMNRMAEPEPYAMMPTPGYDIRNLFDDMGREDFDVGSAIMDALQRRG